MIEVCPWQSGNRNFGPFLLGILTRLMESRTGSMILCRHRKMHNRLAWFNREQRARGPTADGRSTMKFHPASLGLDGLPSYASAGGVSIAAP